MRRDVLVGGAGVAGLVVAGAINALLLRGLWHLQGLAWVAVETTVPTEMLPESP